MNMLKKVLAVTLAAAMLLSLSACTGKTQAEKTDELIELNVFVASQALEMISAAEMPFIEQNNKVRLSINFDDGDMLAAKVEAGYACDVLIEDEKAFVDWLDKKAGRSSNPNKNDMILEGSRTDLFTGPVNEKYADEDQFETTFTGAVIKTSKHKEEAQALLDFLAAGSYEGADDNYEYYGFSRIQ